MEYDLIKANRKRQEIAVKKGIQKHFHNLNGKTDESFGKEVKYGNTKAIIVDSSECTAWKPTIRILTAGGRDGWVWDDQLKY